MGKFFLPLNFSQDATASSEEVMLLWLAFILSICLSFAGVVLSRNNFLIVFLGCLLWVHKIVIGFLLPAVLFFNHTKLIFFKSQYFLVNSLWSSIHKLLSSWQRTLIYFSLIMMTLFLFLDQSPSLNLHYRYWRGEVSVTHCWVWCHCGLCIDHLCHWGRVSPFLCVYVKYVHFKPW